MGVKTSGVIDRIAIPFICVTMGNRIFVWMVPNIFICFRCFSFLTQKKYSKQTLPEKWIVSFYVDVITLTAYKRGAKALSFLPFPIPRITFEFIFTTCFSNDDWRIHGYSRDGYHFSFENVRSSYIYIALRNKAERIFYFAILAVPGTWVMLCAF